MPTAPIIQIGWTDRRLSGTIARMAKGDPEGRFRSPWTHRVSYVVRLQPGTSIAFFVTAVGLGIAGGRALSTSAATWVTIAAAVGASTVGLALASHVLARSIRPPLPRHVISRFRPVEVDGIVVRPPTPDDATIAGGTVDNEVLESNGLSSNHAHHIQLLCEYPELAMDLSTFVISSSADTSTVHGVAMLHNYDPSLPAAELGIWLGPSSRGRKIARRAIRAMAQVAADAGIAELRMGTSTNNHGMIRSFEHSGARFVEQRHHALPNGTAVTSSWWAMSSARSGEATARP